MARSYKTGHWTLPGGALPLWAAMAGILDLTTLSFSRTPFVSFYGPIHTALVVIAFALAGWAGRMAKQHGDSALQAGAVTFFGYALVAGLSLYITAFVGTLGPVESEAVPRLTTYFLSLLAAVLAGAAAGLVGSMGAKPNAKI